MAVLFFPCLHPELVPGTLPRAVKFLDPGLKVSANKAHSWRPQGFPLQEREALRYVHESLAFGEQFRSSQELAYFTGRRLDDFYAHTSQSIRWQFKRRQASSEAGPEQMPPALQAQMMLLMVWTLEEKLIEYTKLNERVQDMDQAIRMNLGVEDSEEESVFFLHDERTGMKHDEQPHWSKILPWFLFWMEDGDGLFVLDREIIAQWKEKGLSFTPHRSGNEKGLDGANCLQQPLVLLQAEASGHELVSDPKDRQFLIRPDSRYSIFCAE